MVTKCLFDTIKDISAKILPSNKIIIPSNEKQGLQSRKTQQLILLLLFLTSLGKTDKVFLDIT